ncbi:MAG: SDR family oxidoreductase [Alphaproteobacteria bacterium]|nr:SDR family oxidoreductase [Alphaproteobacteria bacterium]
MKADQIFDVTGHVSFVTGAANGIGLAMAEVMAANGATVVLADIDTKKLEVEVARLRDAGCAVEPVTLDVADLDALRAAIDGTAERHGRLDAVFANAGISAGPGHNTPQGRLEAIDLAAWERVVHINLTSVMVTVQAAAAHMKKQKAGRIVVTSSIAGLGAEDMVGYAYVSTKAAVANLVRQAGRELAPYNISVNAIAPGPFRTNIGGGRINDPAVEAAFKEMVPAGRIAETEEMMGLILLLASPAASYLTGTVIPIDGGTTA